MDDLEKDAIDEPAEEIDITESILNSVKNQLGGIPIEVTDFDNELIMHINSTIFILAQLGIGPEEPYNVVDKMNTYSDYLKEQYTKYVSVVRTYIYYNVYRLFDHTINSTVVKTIEEKLREIESRILYQIEYDKYKGKEEKNVDGD